MPSFEEEASSSNAYTIPKSPADPRDRFKGLRFILSSLSQKGSFSYETELIFTHIAPNAIENVLYNELFERREDFQTNEKILLISIDPPDDSQYPEEQDETWKKAYKLASWMREGGDGGLLFAKIVITYVLNCKLNYKFDRCPESFFKMEEFDHFLSYAVVNEAKNRDQDGYDEMIRGFSKMMDELDDESQRVRREFQKQVYEVAKRCRISYDNPDPHEDPDSLMPPKMKEYPIVASIKLGLKRFEDGRYVKSDNYEGYVSYLISKKRNGILDISSLSSFWKSVTGVRRAGTILSLRPTNIDLRRFCIALGFDKKIYDNLVKLRNNNPKFKESKYNDKYAATGTVSMKRNEMLDDFLENIAFKLQVVRDIARRVYSNDSAKIPRLMLVYASIELLRAGIPGLVNIERDEMILFGLSKSEANELYDSQTKKEIKQK